MSIIAKIFRIKAAFSDAKRDYGLKTPKDILRNDDIPYVEDGDPMHKLDLYRPRMKEGLLPTIVIVHGGGYVYGTKEIYQYYGMHLAMQGFAVVNYNYRLAPKHKHPSILEDTNRVMEWLVANANDFRLDLTHVFLVGDSAGAQIASQYACIWSNPDYAKRFSFVVPQMTIKAIALNCGLYEPIRMIQKKNFPIDRLLLDYFGKGWGNLTNEMDVLNHMRPQFPPTILACSVNDSITPQTTPLLERLNKLNIDHTYELYGQQNKKTQHVFQVDIRNEDGICCNQSQTDFFKSRIHSGKHNNNDE